MVTITFVKGDITEQDVDAIVNAANSQLAGGSGVDGAIHSKGGPSIMDECRKLRATTYRGGLPVGRAVATTAGDLAARHVIHTVGPMFNPKENRAHLLALCHKESLRVADDLECTTVAFPAISTGVYGYPVHLAAPIAVGAVQAAKTKVEEVRFVLFDDEAYTVFSRQATPE